MDYTVIKQKRKTITIVIDEGLNVVVKVPYRISQKEIQGVVEKHRSWIIETIERKKELKEKVDWYSSGKILYLGEYYPIKVIPKISARTNVKFDQASGFTIEANSEEEARKSIESYYKEEAKKYLLPLSQKYAREVGVSFQKVTIRKQVTRWGSCSAKGNLSYNMKILCAPIPMIEYVVLHEVMHLKHFDHSKVYWNAIEQMMPDYRSRMNYFKQFGQNFMI